MLWAGQSGAAYAAPHVVQKGETLSDVALRYGTTTSALARANGISNPNFVLAGSTLTIPSGGGSAPTSTGGSSHTVQAGETLWDLARRFGTTVDALASANGIANPNLVVAGTTITISGGGGAGSGSTSGGSTSHTVRSGETLSGIAARYGVSVSSLARANGITNPNLVVAGTTITISGGGGAGSGSTSGGSTSHTVRSGETLSDIAARYGVSVSSLARANGLSNPNLVVSGTSLSIPSGGATVTTGGAPAPTTTQVSSSEIGYLLEQEALSNGVSTSLVKAVAYQESGWQPHVVSSAGAIGVMQVMPDTADWVNQVLLGGTSLDVRNAHDNIKMGVSYLRYLLSIMPTQEKALAAYYSGPGNVGSSLHNYQRVYVDAVLAHTSRF